MISKAEKICTYIYYPNQLFIHIHIDVRKSKGYSMYVNLHMHSLSLLLMFGTTAIHFDDWQISDLLISYREMFKRYKKMSQKNIVLFILSENIKSLKQF